MVYSFRPQGVCAMQMNVDVENDIIKSVQIIGGCAGNTKGVSTLLEGMNINDAIKKLKGIDCRGKGTSCPDQLARGLEKIKEEAKV